MTFLKNHKVLVIVIIIISCSLLIALIANFLKVKSTNLSTVKIEGLSVGETLNSELLKNTEPTEPTEPTDSKYDYFFNNLNIKVDSDNKTTELYGNIYGDDGSKLTIGSTDYVKDKNQIKILLGDNCSEKTYDIEQKLKSYIYVDNENDIKATFVFEEQGNAIVGVYLFKNQ